MERRLGHHQGVVGDHQIGAPGPAHTALDEAFAVMGAGRVDALAAPVGQSQGAAVADQPDQPGGKVAAHHVAVAGRPGPAGHQPDRHRALGNPADGARRVFQVEQAEIVLAALADHHFSRFQRGLGVQAVELLVDLALQVLGEGRQPYRALVLLGPQAGGGDIAQGLADPGAGLGQGDESLAVRLAGLERGADRRGVIGLLGTRLGV